MACVHLSLTLLSCLLALTWSLSLYIFLPVLPFTKHLHSFRLEFSTTDFTPLHSIHTTVKHSTHHNHSSFKPFLPTMSPVPTFPIFYRTPPVVTDYDCSTGAWPPYFKRMYLPQKTWQPHYVRKPKSPSSSAAEDAVYALRFDIATRHKYGFPITLATSNGCKRSIASMVEFGEDIVFEGLDKLVLRVQVSYFQTSGGMASQNSDHLYFSLTSGLATSMSTGNVRYA